MIFKLAIFCGIFLIGACNSKKSSSSDTDVPETKDSDVIEMDVSEMDVSEMDVPETDESAKSAKYKVTFTSIWSSQTHSTNFPSNPHFSGLVGVTHKLGGLIWEEGTNSSNGMESMAETGSKVALLGEIDQHIQNELAEFSISGGGITNSPGAISLEFDISSDFSKISLVSMLAPSPDWFVGVNNLELFDNGSWVDSKVVNLKVYDAGTDSGKIFTSIDENTEPSSIITPLTSDSSDTDFIDGKNYIGTFIFEKL